MNDSREDAPVAQLAKKQEAMREKLEQRRERQAAKREKYSKLAADKSARQRRRRKKKEAAMLDALVKSTNHGGFRVGSGRKPDYFRKMGIKPISAAQLLDALDVPKIIEGLINERNPAIRLQTLTMLLNRAYGMPRETGEQQVTGGVPNATSIRVEFVHSKDRQRITLPEASALIEGEVSPEPAPGTASQPPPPLPEPMGTCRFHGDYRLADSQGREICPECKRDSARHERWLAGLQPGGGLQ